MSGIHLTAFLEDCYKLKTSIKTIKLPLVTPKPEICKELDRMFKEFRWVYDETAKRLPSLPRHRIKFKTSPTYYEWVKEFRRNSNVDLPAQTAQQAVLKARESYASMLSNKNYDEIPRSRNNVIGFHNQSFIIERFGNIYLLNIPIKAGRKDNRVLIPFEINDYSDHFLKQAVSKKLDCGASELKRYGDKYYFNLVIKNGVEMNPIYTPIGVDFGLRNIAVACAWSDNKPHVKLWSGKGARHRRRQYLDKIKAFQNKGLLRKVKSLKGRYRDFLKAKNHQVSREIIQFAQQFFQPYIVLEDLHLFRKQNDWTFFELRTFIEYKALEEGISVISVDPRNTSNMCNKCRYTDPENRNGIIFKCLNCGYEVNADVNASVNLANNKL